MTPIERIHLTEQADMVRGKVCSACNHLLPFEDYYRESRGGWRTECKHCLARRSARQKAEQRRINRLTTLPIRIVKSEDTDPSPAQPGIFSQRIINCSKLTDADRMVYIGICHHVGPQGYADIAINQLASDFGLSYGVVRESLKKMETLDIIKRQVIQGRQSIYTPRWH